jgi:hypothetical protein
MSRSLAKILGVLILGSALAAAILLQSEYQGLVTLMPAVVHGTSSGAGVHTTHVIGHPAVIHWPVLVPILLAIVAGCYLIFMPANRK